MLFIVYGLKRMIIFVQFNADNENPGQNPFLQV